MHFLICDSSGNVAVIEFLEGKMVSYTSDELPIAALTNNPYRTTIKYMAEQAKGSHDPDYGKSLESINRSVMQLEQINDYHALESKPDIYDYSFSILNSVSGSATQWSIVYDIGRSRILYRTSGNRNVRILQLRDMDFSCASTEMVLAADANPDDSDSFEEFSLSLNEKLINGVLSNSSFLSDCLEKYRDGMISYPKTTSVRR
jgi:penicillin V acylase-like amidase (Ntn superfamily)